MPETPITPPMSSRDITASMYGGPETPTPRRSHFSSSISGVGGGGAGTGQDMNFASSSVSLQELSPSASAGLHRSSRLRRGSDHSYGGNTLSMFGGDPGSAYVSPLLLLFESKVADGGFTDGRL